MTPPQASEAPLEAQPSRVRLLPALLMGGYAWALTVLPAAIQPEASGLLRLASAVGLGALLLTPWVPKRWTLLLGVDLFVVSALAAWLLAHRAGVGQAPHLFGVLGWLAYTFAWGALSTPTGVHGAEPVDPGPVLAPRRPPSRAAVLLLIALAAATVVLLGASLDIKDPARAILAQVVSLAVLLILARSVAQLGGRWQAPATSSRALPLSWATVALFLMLASVVALGVWLPLR